MSVSTIQILSVCLCVCGVMAMFISGVFTGKIKPSDMKYFWKATVLGVLGVLFTLHGTKTLLDNKSPDGKLITELPPAGTLFEIQNIGTVGEERVTHYNEKVLPKSIIVMRLLKANEYGVAIYASPTQYYDASSLKISGFKRGDIAEVEEHFCTRILVPLKPEVLKLFKNQCLDSYCDPYKERD